MAARCCRTCTLPFPQTNFQPLLAQIPGLGVDVVGSFFAGGGAVQFVKEYAAAGLKVPLCGSGFLTEGTLEAQGAAAEGVETALHYGDGLDNPKNIGFRRAFKDKAGRDADVYAVQGYDAAQLLAVGLEAVNGNIEDEANLYKALRAAKIESPRGPISHVAGAERRRRTSTCARRKAARTRWSASPSRASPTPAPAASWREAARSLLPISQYGEGRRRVLPGQTHQPWFDKLTTGLEKPLSTRQHRPELVEGRAAWISRACSHSSSTACNTACCCS